MNEEEKIFFESSSRDTSFNGSLKEEKYEPRKNLNKSIMLGFVFFILYSSMNAFQTMISQIYFQLGYFYLGNITLISSGFSMCFSSIFAPFVAKFFSFKVSMFFCSFSFIFSQFVGVFTCYCESEKGFILCKDEFLYFLNILFAIMVGFFTVILWICQCGYTTNICDEKNKSLYFGVFFCIFQVSTFSGSVITAFVMKLFQDHLIFFLICASITFVSSFSFLCLPQVDSLSFVENGSLKEKFKDLYEVFRRRNKISIASIAAFCGLEIGFWVGNLFRLIEITLEKNISQEEVNVYTAWVFSCLGFFQILGGITASCLGDRLNKYAVIAIANLAIFISLCFCLILLYEKNYGFCFVVAAFLGTGDCMLQVMINALVSTEGKNITHFSHYVLIQNFAFGFSILFGLTLSSLVDLIIMISSQIILFLIAYYFKN